MKKPVFFLIILILASLAASSPIAPGVLGNAVVVGVCAIILLLALSENDRLHVPTTFLVLLVIIHVSFLLSQIHFDIRGLVGHSDVYVPIGIAYVTGFLIVNVTLLLFIQQYLTWDEFCFIVSRVVSILIIIGIPEILLEQRLLPTGRQPYAPMSAASYLNVHQYVDIDPRALTSIFMDSNAMGKLAIFGVFCSFSEYIRHKRPSSIVFLSITTLGLILADSRGAFVAVTTGLIIYIVLTRFGPELTVVALGGIVGTFVLWMGMVTNVIFQPDIVPDVRMSSRDIAWRGSMETISNSPWFGIPMNEARRDYLTVFGPQNSYFRIMLSAGIIAGIAYIVFIIKSCTSLLTRIDDKFVIIVPFMVALAVIQLFEAFSLFGTNINSVLATIVFGYAILAIVEESQTRSSNKDGNVA